MVGLRPVHAEVVDPLANGPVDANPFVRAPDVKTNSGPAVVPHQRPRQKVLPVNYQTNAKAPVVGNEAQTLPAPKGAAAPKDPCGAVENKSLGQLGISIAEPTGKLPTDLAGPCWAEINQQGEAGARCWPVACYNWEATCFYHNPLYFEEINLERYGYQCGDRSCCRTCFRECCLQPAASAGHFYGSLLALPYCMAAECPGDCVYTLGHYRPGSCNPWRRHYPPFDPVAAASAGGIWTGLVFAIP
jgi:hypothetical protein